MKKAIFVVSLIGAISMVVYFVSTELWWSASSGSSSEALYRLLYSLSQITLGFSYIILTALGITNYFVKEKKEEVK